MKQECESMIKEQYVSFEVAKLLKDKGFKEETHGNYYLGGKFDGKFEESSKVNWNEFFKTPIAAPTQQMAMRWLREVHDIKIMIRPYVDGTYSYEILNGFWYVNFDSYEDAAEEAIKYCLENLVK
jgi:hypothetical protein